MAQKTYVEPRKYEVGPDISQEKYQELVLAIADWFSKTRRTTEPAAAARKAIQDCLDGLKSDGSKWFEASLASLSARIKIKCNFDLDTMQPLMKASEKQKQKKERERARLERKRLKDQDDLHIPGELRAEQKQLGAKRTAEYGTDPKSLLSTKELRYWEKLKRDYIQQFPELAIASAQAELEQLCDMHVLSARYRLKLLNGERVDPNDRARVGEELLRLKKGLGILPDQLEKKVKQNTETTIAAAADKLAKLGNWRELRQRFWVEEMLQLYQMSQEPSADGLGYQLDEIGLFGLTKCRTCHCAKCGHRNYVGISVDELENHLVKIGRIRIEEPDAGSSAPPTA
jgi:hypothetical protein